MDESNSDEWGNGVVTTATQDVLIAPVAGAAWRDAARFSEQISTATDLDDGLLIFAGFDKLAVMNRFHVDAVEHVLSMAILAVHFYRAIFLDNIE